MRWHVSGSQQPAVMGWIHSLSAPWGPALALRDFWVWYLSGWLVFAWGPNSEEGSPGWVCPPWGFLLPRHRGEPSRAAGSPPGQESYKKEASRREPGRGVRLLPRYGALPVVGVSVAQSACNQQVRDGGKMLEYWSWPSTRPCLAPWEMRVS